MPLLLLPRSVSRRSLPLVVLAWLTGCHGLTPGIGGPATVASEASPKPTSVGSVTGESRPAQPSSQPTLAPTQSPRPPSPPPTAVAEADEVLELDSALPDAALDSDLSDDENAAVAKLLDSDLLAGYLSTTLIHDGGVVLFRTLALPQVAARTALKEARKPDRAKPERRALEKKGGRDLRLRQVCENATRCAPGQRAVDATVQVRQIATVEVPDEGGRNKKIRYSELYRREARFRPVDRSLVLEAVSPFSLQTTKAPGRLALRSLTLADQNGLSVFNWLANSPLMPLAKLPSLSIGTRLRVTVQLPAGLPASVEAYAGFPGVHWQKRVPLTLIDSADGLTFSGDTEVLGSPGNSHLVIETLTPDALAGKGGYRSNLMGFSAVLR
ncbi:MAG: hypothetical protein VKP62_00410 [Candidatus Sericytochromatia bacterium]|nr:hypothetical protein [Candidatus Sericytochromatia bacterium]